ncbi:MAG: glycosyl hydrolase [Bacteroidales bacterium]|nr:glycosyl hydrolase [Bacteroidales bacterium]
MKTDFAKYIFAAAALFTVLPACEKLDDKNYGDESYGTSAFVALQDKSPKRGVSFSFEQIPDSDIPLLGPGITWDYNWGTTLSSTAASYFSQYGIDFCPMTWNGNYSESNIASCVQNGSEYLLGFNEPNLTDQANMTPSQAAELWPDVVAIAKKYGLKLISPAMNYGTLSGYSDPCTWLDEFFAIDGISLDDIDGIAVHCYMNTLSGLKSYIEKFSKYGKPIWLTEFCGYSGSAISASSQINYMVECINYLESNDNVARYAWFIPRGNAVANVNNELLTSKTPVALTDIGTVFVNMSTWDSSLYYSAGTKIPAEHYTSCNGTVHLRITKDESGTLDVSDLKNGNWVEYQIQTTSSGTYSLQLRLSDYAANSLEVSVGGGDATTVDLENLSNEWETVTVPVSLPKGYSTIRIAGPNSSPVYLNWLEFKK